MNKYESAVAVNGQLESDAKNAVLEKVRGLITRSAAPSLQKMTGAKENLPMRCTR